MKRDRSGHHVRTATGAGDSAGTDRPHAPTILVVDDDPDMRIYIKRCLRRMCGEVGLVLEAGDGAAALERARRTHVDLVISDVVMPRMDGVALIQALRSDESLAGIAVLLVTGELSSRDVREQAGSTTLVDILAKPFNTDKLCAKVRRLLSRSPPRDRGEDESS